MTSTGNAALHTATMTGVVSCSGSVLDPGTSITCTAVYTTSTTTTDVRAGQATSTATAAALAPSGVRVTAQAALTIRAVRAAAISITKTASTAGFAAARTPITYLYTVTNTGDLPLQGITVTDTMTRAVTCPQASLPAGASMTCTAAYTTTLADVDHGTTPTPHAAERGAAGDQPAF